MAYYKSTPVSEIRRKAEKKIEQLRKKDPSIAPIVIAGNKIAKTWWAKAWNSNLERYADYSNRIGRGKSYVRNSAVIDLKIERGKVRSKIQGSRNKPYEVTIYIDKLSQEKWNTLLKRYSHKIESFEALISGEFPKELEGTFTEKGEGLFPEPDEIHFECTCPDWAYMCKHVAATLYGIGARFDEDPTLFFLLRDIDFHELIRKSVDVRMNDLLAKSDLVSSRELKSKNIYTLFEIDEE